MDANVFIKSVTVEGNKIKNIQFYGDWNVDLGGSSGEAETIIVGEGKKFNINKTDSFLHKKEGSTTYVRFTFPSNINGYVIIRQNLTVTGDTWSIQYANPNINYDVAPTNGYTDVYADGKYVMMLFDDAGNFISGYILTNGARDLN